MASCLGLYIEKNLIKYAKVSKSSDNIKVESFGIKFFDDMQSAIKQIIDETYSFKKTNGLNTPISINVTDEIYNQFEVFSMLNKTDIKGVIKTEFENICYDKGINKNIYEQKFIFANSTSNGEKVKVIHISVPKTTLAEKKNQFAKNRVNCITPIGLTIPNLIKKNNKDTVLIVNIEKNTTITKVKNGIIIDVNVLPFGAQDILGKIKEKENSFAKAYEICKNATIYTEDDKDLQYEENEYLEDIMPTLFKIVTEVRKNIDDSLENIEKVYITGIASAINNIDIYFQEYLKNIHCEILKPDFVNSNSKINIKDYIEVNSAISIALQGLEKSNDINFNKESSMEKFLKLLNTDASNVNINTKNINNFFAKFDKQFNVVFLSFLLLTISYTAGTLYINNKINKKMTTAITSIDDTNKEINILNSYNTRLNNKISEYDSFIKNLENANNNSSEDKRYKNTIPNLLNNIMTIIPKQVQLTSIDNTSDTHIVIQAKSNKYEQIAFFKTKLKTEGILKNVVSDTGIMQAGSLSVTIEGELP